MKHLAGAFILLGASGAASATCLNYEPAEVTLSGTIVHRTFHGPPNYGEDPATDSRETQSPLKLDHPICTVASTDGDDESERDQREVTLVPFDVDVRRYLGMHVGVTGTLFHAMTGHHHTPVLLDIHAPSDIGISAGTRRSRG